MCTHVNVYSMYNCICRFLKYNEYASIASLGEYANSVARGKFKLRYIAFTAVVWTNDV